MIGTIALSVAGLVFARRRKAKAAAAAAAAGGVPALVAAPVPPALPNSAALRPLPASIPIQSESARPQPVTGAATSPLLYPPYQPQGFVGPGAPAPSTEES